MDEKQAWKLFENAARSIIRRHRDEFGLESVEKSVTKVQGQSGIEWNIDVVGNTAESDKPVIFEVRRKRRNVEPEEIAAIAYRIKDTKSQKGYIVTRTERGLSSGAETLAGFEQIGHIRISEDATPESYLMSHLDNLFLGLMDTMEYDMKDSLRILVKDKDGNVVREVTEKELDGGKC